MSLISIFVQLDFSSNGVMTNKKSSLILIYYNRGTGINTEKGGTIKTGKWNQECY